MSRKNKAYGNSWLVKRFNPFKWQPYFILRAWTHRGCGPWWAVQSVTEIVSYDIAHFDSIADYKKYCRDKRNPKEGSMTWKQFCKYLETK